MLEHRCGGFEGRRPLAALGPVAKVVPDGPPSSIRDFINIFESSGEQVALDPERRHPTDLTCPDSSHRRRMRPSVPDPPRKSSTAK